MRRWVYDHGTSRDHSATGLAVTEFCCIWHETVNLGISPQAAYQRNQAGPLYERAISFSCSSTNQILIEHTVN